MLKASCRTYLVPADRREEALKILDEVEHYWDAPLREEPYPENCAFEVPDWIREIPGLHSLTFASPEVM